MDRQARPARILVAEDDPALRRLIEMLLCNQGYEVRAVGDGVEALETAAEWPPDALVVDVMMPRLSGLSVCRELRAQTEFATVPIILLTARCFDEDIQAVMDLGSIEFMSKPFNPRQLMAALEQAVPDADGGHRPAAIGAAPRLNWVGPPSDS